MPLANQISADLDIPWQKGNEANNCKNGSVNGAQVLSTPSSEESNANEDDNCENCEMQVDEIGSVRYELEIEFTNVTKAGHPAADPSQFELLQILGEGSFGKVFLVRKIFGPDTGTLYAMKVLRKATLKIVDRARSKKERDILVEVNHPFIVKLNYAFQTEGKLFLVLDFLRGGDLFTRLNKQVMFTEEDAKFYLAEIALALDHLHSLGIIYRDLKPENILLDQDGHICLTDFGLSKESLRDKKTYSFVGTIEYISPELIKRTGHGAAVDWWSFGVLTYEMLTGNLPFLAPNRKETMQKILRERLSMPTYLSPDAQDLLRCLFKRTPANRLGSGPTGGQEIKGHRFFASIDFNKLYLKQITPPYKPSVMHNNFSFCEKSTSQYSPGVPVSANSHELFRGFSFIAPSLSDDMLNNNKNTAQKCQTNPNNSIAIINQVQTINNSNKMIIDAGPASITSQLKLSGIRDKQQGIKALSEFDFYEVIGTGSFSTCYKCLHKESRRKFAAKKIDKFKRDCSEEVEIMLRFSEHPNIVTLHNFCETHDSVYLFMDLLEGGELLDRILKKKYFCEREASEVIEVIAKTIQFLHANNCAHRDLKPENIIYADNSDNPQSIRICDFGFAKQMRAGNGLLMTPCYTANFVAPEVLKKQGYDETCDIWSMGVLLYTMLCGHTPFTTSQNDSPSTILKQISESKLDLVSGNWANVSDLAKSLTQKMLYMDPKKRYRASDVLKDDFIALRKFLPTVNLTTKNNEPVQKINESMGRVFNAINAPNTIVQLDPVLKSDLARRRAKNNLKNKSL